MSTGVPRPSQLRTAATSPVTWARTQSGDRTSSTSVFALGAVYAVYGGVMLALYALGMTIPLFILAFLWKRAGSRIRSFVTPRTITVGPWENTWTMVVSGALSVAIGVFLLVTDGTADLGGVFTIGTQYEAESSLSSWSQNIPDVWFLVGAVVVLALLPVWNTLRRKKPDATLGPVVDATSVLGGRRDTDRKSG